MLPLLHYSLLLFVVRICNVAEVYAVCMLLDMQGQLLVGDRYIILLHCFRVSCLCVPYLVHWLVCC